ncbi:MAG: hypothetical protein CVT59_02890 [Actinobacteria bacterium HGW-Actinobacteria-1]|nr:MAG: hypothetical protein CVT59_02890 [Actinobacteria bacterium HGW-Actinobacteria-1]
MTDDTNLDVAAARAALGRCEPDPVLAERGIPLPSRSQAAWTLLELYIGDIASGKRAPEEGMRLIGDEVIRPAGMAYSTYKAPGESHDIGALLALEDEYDDIRRHELRAGSADRRRPGVDARVVQEAREWMERNSGRGGAPKLF